LVGPNLYGISQTKVRTPSPKFTNCSGAQQYASQGPTILQVNLNGREIAKEIYSDVSKFQESEKERLKVF
ncbi:hypothetical protein N3930_38735, partial [Bacillus thuringiensis]|nr:hypothetical protein [Bacillus thuringiensis]